jgi:antitoxin component of MazEF toxin-antitoxin module
MKARVIRIGEEVAVVLPKEIVVALTLKEDQALHIRKVDDTGFRLGTTDPIHEKGLEIARKLMVDYAETLRALAKS